MKRYYFDTDPLTCWAQSRVPNPDARNDAIGRVVDQLIQDGSVRTAISEITLREWHTNAFRDRRQTEAPFAHFDDVWLADVQQTLMGFVSAGLLRLLPMPPKAFQTAMGYVTMATTDYGRRFKAWDAVHLVYASYWARSVGEPVILVSSDEDFAGFLGAFPEFGAFVQLLNPSP